jgi:hypothetical protein
LWRKFTVSVAIDYFDMNDPLSVERINGDAAMACNMLAAAQEQRAPLTGWDMCPEQLDWLRNDPTRQLSPNGFMKVSHLDIYTASDSTHKMYPKDPKQTAKRDIRLELEEHNKHCTVAGKPGGTQTDLLNAIIEVGQSVQKNEGSPLAGTTLHFTWNINEVFNAAGEFILGDYDASLALPLGRQPSSISPVPFSLRAGAAHIGKPGRSMTSLRHVRDWESCALDTLCTLESIITSCCLIERTMPGISRRGVHMIWGLQRTPSHDALRVIVCSRRKGKVGRATTNEVSA